MIDIDIIRKKRDGATAAGTTAGTVAVAGGTTVTGNADYATKAGEADHAANADNAAHADSARELDGNSSVWQKLRDTVAALDDDYLSKTSDDTAQGLIAFAKGLVSKAVADFSDGLRSTDYDNAAEQGFSIEKTAAGRYQAFLTNLTIWGKAVFNELEIRKLSYAGGNVYLSGAGSKIVKAVPVKMGTAAGGGTSSADGSTSSAEGGGEQDGKGTSTDESKGTSKSTSASESATWVECEVTDADCVGWKCYLLADDGTTATMNNWQEGDQARCQTMGEITSAGSYQDASNRSYWRTIPDGDMCHTPTESLSIERHLPIA